MTPNKNMFNILDIYLGHGLHQLNTSSKASAKGDEATNNKAVPSESMAYFEFAQGNTMALTNMAIQHGSEEASEILSLLDELELGLIGQDSAVEKIANKLKVLFDSALGQGLRKKFSAELGLNEAPPEHKPEPKKAERALPHPTPHPQMTML
ncbi:hypothetical protein [Shewanella colwelliana]|uniref:hypothetical protein n=1 Tax=Shewanella colwelliana TaxID=23 RepID=UPI0022AFE7D8|nr:hypothetical protein [Shewanella colwelliana]MCZ4337720.1 hypothetical protein [Shewanella colwelliana]